MDDAPSITVCKQTMTATTYTDTGTDAGTDTYTDTDTGTRHSSDEKNSGREINESFPLLAIVEPLSKRIERNVSEPVRVRKLQALLVPVDAERKRSQSVSVNRATTLRQSAVSYGSVEVTDLMNVDPNSLVVIGRRASFGGCMIDIGELTELLSHEEDSNKSEDEMLESLDATYWKLMRYNRPFALYILSYFSAHVGEWFTYVAAITAVEHISPDSQTAVSVLVAIRMVPNIIFSSIGGALADSVDRRVAMIALDIIGMFVVLLYLPVLHFRSLPMLYFVVFVQATVAAIYDPIRQAIVPLLVPQEEYLKKATTLAGLAWSLMAAVGASLGGIVASLFGLSVCFSKFQAPYSSYRFTDSSILSSPDYVCFAGILSVYRT